MSSLSDIAKKAGVSIATVSLALRGQGQVAAATAERVRQIAKELHYKPNPLIASLATRRFRKRNTVEGTPLGILEFQDRVSTHKNSIASRYIEDVKTWAADLGYRPTVYPVKNSTPTEPIFRELYHRMAQGIIIVGSMDMATFGATMPWEHFPVICCARFEATLPFHTVRPNIFQGIKLAFETLMRRGYRRIGFSLGLHEVPIEDDEARHGAAIALENRYLVESNRIPPFAGMINDTQAFNAWVAKYRPDAVIAFTSAHYWHLRDAGFRIPEDIGFACMHINPGDAGPAISGLQQNRAEISRQCVLQLDQLIRHRERGLPVLPLHILVPSLWVEGSTLRQPA